MTFPDRQESTFHYAWIIAITGTIVIMPASASDASRSGCCSRQWPRRLRLSYAQIGLSARETSIGYLAAVLLCAPLAKKIGSRQLIVIALAIIAVSMVSSAGRRAFFTVLLLYLITGIGSGAANVP